MAAEIRWLFHVNSPPTILWKLSPQKPKVNDVCVLCKYSNFRSRILGMQSNRPRFQNFSSGHVHAPGPPRKLHFWCSQVTPVARVFSFSAFSKAFATLTYLKPHGKPCFYKDKCEWNIHTIDFNLG